MRLGQAARSGLPGSALVSLIITALVLIIRTRMDLAGLASEPGAFRVGLHYRAHTRRPPAERAVHLDPCHPDNNNTSNGPISSVGPSISSVTFNIEDFDIECSFDIDV